MNTKWLAILVAVGVVALWSGSRAGGEPVTTLDQRVAALDQRLAALEADLAMVKAIVRELSARDSLTPDSNPSAPTAEPTDPSTVKLAENASSDTKQRYLEWGSVWGTLLHAREQVSQAESARRSPPKGVDSKYVEWWNDFAARYLKSSIENSLRYERWFRDSEERDARRVK